MCQKFPQDIIGTWGINSSSLSEEVRRLRQTVNLGIENNEEARVREERHREWEITGFIEYIMYM